MSKQTKPTTQNNNQYYIRSKLEVYHFFQSNQTYQKQFAYFRKKVKQADAITSKMIVSVIKQLLTYRHILTLDHIAFIEGWSENQIIEQQWRGELTQFSKLLALRFIREVYFQCYYSFMILVDVQLPKVLLKIGLFCNKQQHDERGKHIFQEQDKEQIFIRLGTKGIFSKSNTKQLQVIGFSIHKITLQILHVSDSLFKCLPFNQSFCCQLKEKHLILFKSHLSQTYEQLVKNNVKFPSQFHYFKEKDSEKIAKIYASINSTQSIQIFYNHIFQKILTYSQQFINTEDFQNGELTKYLQIKINQQKDYGLSQLVKICRLIGNESNDRYFWNQLTLFISVQIVQRLSSKQTNFANLQKILSINFFISFMSFHLANLQMLYLIQQTFIDQLYQLFIIALEQYCKINRNRSKHSHGKQIIKITDQQKKMSSKVLVYLLKLFELLKQIAIQFSNSLKQKCSKLQQYPRINTYIDILLRISPAVTLDLKINTTRQWIYKQLVSRITNAQVQQFQKLSLIFVYYVKNQDVSSSVNEIKKKMKNDLTIILKQQQELLKIVGATPQSSCVQYITLGVQQIDSVDIDNIVVQVNTTKQTHIRSQSAYKLNRGTQQKRNNSTQPVGSKIVVSEVNNKPSFLNSLKIDIERPCQGFMKSLSSRKLSSCRNISKSKQNASISNISYEIDKQNKSEQHSLRVSANDKVSQLIDFKQVFKQQNVFAGKQLYFSSTRNNRILQKRHQSNISQNIKYYSSANKLQQQYVFTQNLPQQIKTNQQPNFKQTERIVVTQIIDCGGESSTVGRKYLPISSGGQHRYKQNNISEQGHTQQNKMKRRKYIDSVQLQNNGSESKAKIQKHFKNRKLSRISNRSRLSLKQQSSHSQQTCYCFSSKVKRQLMKKKVLIKRNEDAELGMITNLLWQILSNERKTVKKYKLVIKVYFTGIKHLQNVLLDITCPGWLECSSKNNYSLKDIQAGQQFVASFVVQISKMTENQFKRNYGQFPILNVSYTQNDVVKQFKETLPIMITKFAIQKPEIDPQLNQIVEKVVVSNPFPVHQKIGTTLAQMKSYFSNLSLVDLDPAQKCSLFSNFSLNVKDQIGAVRLQFLNHNQQILLIFFQTGNIWGNDSQNISNSNLGLMVQLQPLKQEQWDFEQLHILKTSLRSILSDV